jgi:hypothetical protein
MFAQACNGKYSVGRERRIKLEVSPGGKVVGSRSKAGLGKSGRHYLKNKSKQKGLEEWFN